MDINNPGALALLIGRIIAVLLIAIYVIPITVKELRRKQYSKELYILRWTLFLLSVLYVLPSIFPIWSGATRINEQPLSTLSTVASYWQGVREVAIGVMIVIMFYFAKLISRSHK